jgi:Ran GTPase-activating protein (RanGAP) involved in mRNA processing and transport
MSHLTLISCLSFAYTPLGVPLSRKLFLTLHEFRQLQSLNLRAIQCGSVIHTLSSYIQSSASRTLASLDISQNEFGDTLMKRFINTLCGHEGLTTIWCDGNALSKLSTWTRICRQNPKLQYLSIRSNHYNNDAALGAASVFFPNYIHKPIDNASAQSPRTSAIAPQENQNLWGLRWLDLGENLITSSGLLKISSQLPLLKCLQVLRLDNCVMDNKCQNDLFRKADANPSLLMLDTHRNNLPRKSPQKLLRLLNNSDNDANNDQHYISNVSQTLFGMRWQIRRHQQLMETSNLHFSCFHFTFPAVKKLQNCFRSIVLTNNHPTHPILVSTIPTIPTTSFTIFPRTCCILPKQKVEITIQLIGNALCRGESRCDTIAVQWKILVENKEFRFQNVSVENNPNSNSISYLFDSADALWKVYYNTPINSLDSLPNLNFTALRIFYGENAFLEPQSNQELLESQSMWEESLEESVISHKTSRLPAQLSFHSFNPETSPRSNFVTRQEEQSAIDDYLELQGWQKASKFES